MKSTAYLCLMACFLACNTGHQKTDHQIIEVPQVATKPTLDGLGTETHWNMANWLAIDQNWLGPAFDREDFRGRYKIAWDKENLYVLVEIQDDTLVDKHRDPLKLWWDDDCVEVFVDEDNSGGLHQFSHNAFAYHIGLDGNVVDLGPDRQPHLYNEHIAVARTQDGNLTTWELAIKVFPDTYIDNGNTPASTLKKGKKIGFAMAYCDNDNSEERENFIGSVFVPGEDKNQGWINADIFGTLVLN